jgi:Domain of unknown function (DUF4198)
MIIKFGILMVAGFLAAAARAHDTWLQPERFTATPGATLQFELTSAAGFVAADTAIKPERVARSWFLLGSEAMALVVGEEKEQALSFSASLVRPGVAVVCVELKPRALELAPDKIEPYFREIHAGERLRAAWEEVPGPRRWRERTVKTAKCFVRVGEPAAAERAWTIPVGVGLEIVPERDPTALRVGDELPVRVLRKGQPLAGFALAYVSAGETREYVVITDTEGRGRARFDVKGIWLVHGTDLRRVAEPELEWESDFTTMVVEVQ